MWDDRGFFYYRVLRLGTIRTSYHAMVAGVDAPGAGHAVSGDAAAASHRELARVPA